MKLDTYLGERGVDAVALMKLDVEGYELAALRGAAAALGRRAVAAIYFEYFEKYLVRVGPPDALIAFLECWITRSASAARPTWRASADPPTRWRTACRATGCRSRRHGATRGRR